MSKENADYIDDTCLKCGNNQFISTTDRCEIVCKNCGLVVRKENLNRGADWRAFTLQDKMNKPRAGSPTSNLIYDKGLSTSFNPRDVKNSVSRARMWRLKKWDTRTKLDKSGIRNLSIALSNLDRIAEVLHLPNKVKEQASSIYRKALERDLIRGRSIKGFVAASLYAACRQLRIPRSLKEVSKASMEELKTVSRTYRLLIQEHDLQMPVDYPMKFVPKIAAETGIAVETEMYAVQLLRRAKNEKITAGKDPRGMASAAIYMACKVLKDKCTQREIAASAGTSEVTLRNRLRDFEEMFTMDEFETFTYSQVIEQLSPNLN